MVCRFGRTSFFAPTVGLLLVLLICSVCLARELIPTAEVRNSGQYVHGPDGFLAFAEYLFRSGDFMRAAREYEKFIELFESHPAFEKAYYMAGLSWFKAGKWAKAEKLLLGYLGKFPDSSNALRAMYILGICKKESGDPISAAECFMKAAASPDPELADKARLLAAGCLLYRCEVGKVLNLLGSARKRRGAAMTAAEAIKEAEAEKRRDAVLAGGLSVFLPGAGQIYLGRLRHGFVTLFLNGLTAAGAYEAYSNGDKVMAAGLALLESIWYLANIYGAVNAVEKGAKKKEARAIADLVNSLPDPDLVSVPRGRLMAGFEVDF